MHIFRCGLAGNSSPHYIIPTSVTIDEKVFVLLLIINSFLLSEKICF
jgi:hypothetical protein